ncbi:DUF4118 domain-containing protein [Anaerocolumna sp. AGMB13025]|uniref:DUF4118 domain-containing protein n=1 Tax=Anaerocolumna sp. AGMB13025 TaxID=3039116 RepID=UPI00241FE3A5|nr:DUF4118 domain-containing protein [Anaerocolumna sp. AGMB13025]WFR60055.1 DUF4118 domain-containing protein [Anaerocolumna sp. AGMB13025]
MYRSRSDKANNKSVIKQIVITIILNLSTTLLSLLIRHIGFTEVNIVVIYILSVLITSQYTNGYAYGVAASVASMLFFNFFFTEPLYSFKVYDNAYLFTFMIMLLSAIFTSTLTSKLIKSKELSREQETQAKILYRITSSLAKTSDVTEVAAVSAQCLSNMYECDVNCIFINIKENEAKLLIVEKDVRGYDTKEILFKDIKDFLLKYYSLPIKVRNKVICFICLPKDLEQTDNKSRFLLDSILMQITIAMEREFIKREEETAKSETERERFKSNLLRAISHDLRTPLTRITGSSEMLLHNLVEDDNKKFVLDIYEDSIWLTRLVENILSLTKIQEGRLSVNLQFEAAEEIVAEAIERAAKYSPEHKISTALPEEVIFIPMDGKLIVQVLINLISNAIEHTTPSNEIIVTVKPEHKKIWFEVSDNGTGIKEEDLNKIFDMYFVSNNTRTDGKQGMGLGLAICKAIINFHGGEIYALNNTLGGATFRFYLNQQGGLK